MKTKLGQHRGKEVKFDMRNAPNKNIVIFGSSGTGKSTEEQKIAVEIVAQGRTAVMLDCHQVLGEDEIFWKHKEKFNLYMNEINAYEVGIACDLFEPMIHSDGVREDSADAIYAVLDVLDRTLKFGHAQKAALRMAISHVVEEGAYGKEGFRAIDQEGKINIIRLSKFDLGTQETVAEMILSYIWRLAVVNYFRRKEIFLFVDEFQNLPSGKRSSLAQILSEGRKFGVNLILATQQLPRSNASVVQQSLMQCGLILYFKPGADQVRVAAKMIDPENVNEWMQVLRGLKKGEFVASGTLELSGHRIECPLRVSAFEKPCNFSREADGQKPYTPERGKTYMNNRIEWRK